jgi:exopolysaccharide biosynthesis polyprenyl glycosylphosphotransferase
MRLSTHQNQDRLSAVRRLAGDMAIWIVAFFVGAAIRFAGSPDRLQEALLKYAPGLVISSLGLVATAYICGLYSNYGNNIHLSRRLILITSSLFAASLVLLLLGSINFTWQVGRGVLLLSVFPAIFLIWIHHFIIHKVINGFKERAAVVISSEEDEVEAQLLEAMDLRNTTLIGCYARKGYVPRLNMKCLGCPEDAWKQAGTAEIDRIFCTTNSLKEPDIALLLRKLRYSGTAISSIALVCEENYQAIPLGIIDDEWLLHACAQPDHMYIAKIKRLADILVSISLGIMLLPLLLTGAMLVMISGGSGGIFYRQERLGRFGRPFEVIKLRTMVADAEATGARWSTKNDPRVTPIGRFLRKFRIDEIPQLWNILRGDMSFVGPRPERKEFADKLSEEIPYFSERLLILPGLTGWAQVCYPYGSTVEDARRKLEFDLYYLKNMGLVMDLFVLLDTIKIVLMGGASRRRGDRLAEFENKLKGAGEKVRTMREPTFLDAS